MTDVFLDRHSSAEVAAPFLKKGSETVEDFQSEPRRAERPSQAVEPPSIRPPTTGEHQEEPCPSYGGGRPGHDGDSVTHVGHDQRLLLGYAEHQHQQERLEPQPE